MALFNFKLKELADVMPWGDENHKRLHWFGLTDGNFYMDVGGEKLFHSTDEISEYWKRENPEFAPKCNFVDYHVVRPYEDLLNILPDILQPIPDIIFNYVDTFEHQAEFDNRMRDYWDLLDDDAEPCDAFYDATEWINLRQLPTLHLKQGPDIWFLLNNGQLIIRWDNENKYENGIPLWSSTSGEFRMQVDEFIAEVNGFHNRLMHDMENRIDILLKNNPIPDIDIDLEGLVKEHRERKLSLMTTMNNTPNIKDWDAVQNAIMVFA
jgi:hypothetical protein